jgi:Fe-S cluster assembly ATP-binding protein
VTSILTFKNVTLKKGDTTILDDVSLDVWKGHIHAIIGPNGAGKSTLSYVMMGLDGYRKIDGTLEYEGKVINDWTVTKRAQYGLTLAWQEPARYEGITVKHYLELSQSGREVPLNVSQALEEVGLEPKQYLHRSIDTSLSGGERKRIELASIFLMQPKVVILDEPDSGIDIEAIHNIFGLLEKLKQQGTTIILVTHSIEVLEKTDHAFLICDGKVRDKGPTPKIKNYFEKRCIGCDPALHIGSQGE